MTDRRISVSVVTVTRNDRNALKRTLDSVGAQSCQPDEHIIIDGLSSDGTKELVMSLEKDSLVYVCEPDTGIYDAMNKGWRIARGDYVQFLNAGDTYAAEGSLALVRDRLTSWSPTWATAGAYNVSAGVRIGNIPHSWLRHALGGQSHCHQSCFFERRLLDLLGGMAETYGFAGDFDLLMRCGMLSHPLEIPETVVCYEGNGISHVQRWKIPLLLHRIRVDRLEAGAITKRVDFVWTLWRLLHLALVDCKGRLRSMSQRA